MSELMLIVRKYLADNTPILHDQKMLCSWLQDALSWCFTNSLLIPVFLTLSVYLWQSFLVLSYVFLGHLRPFHDFAVSEKTKNQHLNFQSLSCKWGILWSSFPPRHDIFMHFSPNDNSIKTRRSEETGSKTSDLQTGLRTGSLEVTEIQFWVKHLIF